MLTFLLMAIANLNPGTISQVLGSNLALFFLSYSTSLISASLGMSRLLMNGPSKLIKKQGYCGGYLQWGFLVLFLSIATSFAAKAAWIGSFGAPEIFQNIPIWIGISYLPQFLMVIISNTD